ncbi:MAG TPA: phosphonate ABC transporter, permease protein PhnE [Methylomirabilota bacterium]|nr:phosphonate ABC transporter, permease protein PhnE [Methylomirabilota bacterium]
MTERRSERGLGPRDPLLGRGSGAGQRPAERRKEGEAPLRGTWRRFTPLQAALRTLAQLALGVMAAVMIARLGIHWEYIADAPWQITDLLGRMLPPEWSAGPALVGPLVQTINIATLGTALAIALSLPVALLAALNTTLNRATYGLARLVMVVSRSVDTLIWALIFIIVVGPGSLAGVLAVAVRSIGFVSKLLAEGIEEIDAGQVEAVAATGASRWQVLLYAIVPQVRPVFAGVVIYRWDINIRESTVLGLVGAGGIGFALNEAILGLEWSRVGMVLTIVLAIVIASEAGSAWLRRRLT